MTRSDIARQRHRRGSRHMVLLLTLWFGLQPLAFSEETPQDRTRSLRGLTAEVAGIRNPDEPIKCGFLVIAEGLRQRAALTPETRAMLTLLMARPSLQTSILSGMFRIHFDTTGANTPALLDASHQRIPGTARAYIDSVARILNRIADELETRYGYSPPPTDGMLGGGPEYDVYVEDLLLYGLTSPDVDIPDGSTVTNFMEIDNDFTFVFPDSNRGLPALRVTLAHEYHHAIQVGSYAFWQSEVYFHEMTSVWMEELLFTEVNDYYQYLRSASGQFMSPDVPFTTSDDIAYSRGIWGIYLEKRFGTEMMRKIWEACREVRPIRAIDATLRQAGINSSMTAAFTDWALWNFWTGSRTSGTKYYPEAAAYPQIVQIPTAFVPPTTTIGRTLPPLATRYHQILIPAGSSRFDTLTLVVNNIDYASALTGTLVPVSYTWYIASTAVDPSYQQTRAGVYVKLDVANPINWTTWLIEDSVANPGQGPANLAEGLAFPNPFTPDGSRILYIPLDDPAPVTGTLSIFTGNMDRIYDSGPVKSSGISRQLFSWDGRTSSGQGVPSGIYVYVLALDGGKTVRGKIAVLRK